MLNHLPEKTELPHKPLVEAIFELKWDLSSINELGGVDPNYKLLVGLLFNRLKDHYPYHQALAQASMPEEISSHIVQHRFRTKKNHWPLVQIGPGIATLNDTDSYDWKDFQAGISELVTALYEVYPDSDHSIRPVGLLLRYIDAIEFDFDKKNLFEFLRDHLKLDVKFDEELFENSPTSNHPIACDLRFRLPLSSPPGSAFLRFARGEHRGRPALIWETQVIARPDVVPESLDDICAWTAAAHEFTHSWFFKTLSPELLKRFE